MNAANLVKSIFYPFLLLVSLAACSQEPKYYREQCIVRINFDWGTMPVNTRYDVMNQFAKVFPIAPKKSYNQLAPSSAWQGDNDEYLYIQHTAECENRLANTEDLLVHVRNNLDLVPKMEVDSGTFKPSISTIKVSGSEWIDSDPPIGEPIEIDGKKYIKVE